MNRNILKENNAHVQMVYEEMLCITKYQGNANKYNNVIHSHTTETGVHPIEQHQLVWCECGEKETLINH